MLEAAIHALFILFDPARLGFLSLGVVLGLAIGALPGLGGLVGLSLLLPFTFSMDPYSAFALMMGLLSVVATSDTIPAVLFGVPGTVGAAATVIDGYPMAQRGEAGRALGAAFSASVMGGLLGALLLAVSIPVIRPFILLTSTAELLALCIFGLSLVATLSGRDPLKGLIAAGAGIIFSLIGEDSQVGIQRWTFDSLYLWEGMPIVPVALGLFALPELADLAISRAKIAANAAGDIRAGQWQGIRDVFRNWFLVVRCSLIGAGLGALPGIGASIIDWVAYGHGARSTRGGSETFGKGDVRGVISAESSNNAAAGGALVPTIAFGVPGTPSMALILGALLIQGIVPGPAMLSEKLDLTYTLVWSVALANVLGAGLCFLGAGQLARIAVVRPSVLVPVVLVFVFVGAFQGRADWGDFTSLLFFGALGWIMKRNGWARPPLVLGFVLGDLIETYLFISTRTFGSDWLMRPMVLIIFAITLWGIASPLWRKLRKQGGLGRLTLTAPRYNSNLPLTLFFTAGFAVALWTAWEWPSGAGIGPRIVSISALVFCAAAIFFQTMVARRDGDGPASRLDVMDIQSDFPGLSSAEVWRRAGTYFAACVLFVLAATVINILPSILLFLILYMRFLGGETWRKALLIGIGWWVPVVFIFDRFINVPWPQALINDVAPWIRDTIGVI